MKKPSKSKHSTPTTFKFDSLEDQTSHALYTRQGTFSRVRYPQNPKWR